MLSLSDLAVIFGMSLASSLVVGIVGLVVLSLTRRSSMLVQLIVVVVAAIVSMVMGMTLTAQWMYVSGHDLLVTLYIAGASAIVTVGLAFVLGRSFTKNSNRVRMLARSLADGERVTAATGRNDNSELAALERDLAVTSERLAAAREEVAALDASRRELVAWISHDLRTPLAGLRAMAEALEDDMADDPQRFHRQMRSQVDHLSAMVDDLFELSKINSGTLSLNVEPVSLFDLASDAVAELAELARSRDITLKAPDRGDFTVAGDPRELSRVVGNLLVNAIQHSPAGSTISVTTGHGAAGEVVLTVEDAGGGIPEQDLSNVFQAGWRATSSRTPEQLWGQSGGAGLGLAIVQGIVEAHSGDISVSNVPGGCRFDVRLPRHEVVAA